MVTVVTGVGNRQERRSTYNELFQQDLVLVLSEVTGQKLDKLVAIQAGKGDISLFIGQQLGKLVAIQAGKGDISLF